MSKHVKGAFGENLDFVLLQQSSDLERACGFDPLRCQQFVTCSSQSNVQALYPETPHGKRRLYERRCGVNIGNNMKVQWFRNMYHHTPGSARPNQNTHTYIHTHNIFWIQKHTCLHTRESVIMLETVTVHWLPQRNAGWKTTQTKKTAWVSTGRAE